MWVMCKAVENRRVQSSAIHTQVYFILDDCSGKISERTIFSCDDNVCLFPWQQYAFVSREIKISITCSASGNPSPQLPTPLCLPGSFYCARWEYQAVYCLSAKFRQSTTRSEARYETEDRRVAPCAHKKKKDIKKKARDESRFDLRGVHAHLTAGSARADIKWRRCCCSLPASLLP